MSEEQCTVGKMVRDDIISLDSFVAARFKYEPYLQLIRDAGNYCFLDQFKRHFENGDYIISQMEQYNLVKTESLNNNYKYIYLTDTAMKYLVLKDDLKDYSQVPKNQISVMKISKYPSEKVLMSAALKFAFIADGENRIIVKEQLIKALQNQFHKQYKYIDCNENRKNLENEMDKIKKAYWKEKEINERIIESLEEIKQSIIFRSSNDLIDVKVEKEQYLAKHKQEYEELGRFASKDKKEEKMRGIINYASNVGFLKEAIKISKTIEEHEQVLKQKLQEFRNECDVVQNQLKQLEQLEEKNKDIEEKYEKLKKKVVNLYDKAKLIPVFSGNKLQFCILDTGNTKTAYGYLKTINELKEFGYLFNEVQVIIISYSQKRAEHLKNEFDRTQEDRQRALDQMEKYEQEYGLDRSYMNSWRYAPPEFYKKAKVIHDNTPEIKVGLWKSTWYMKNYKKNLSMSTNYIKRKDKKAIEELKNKLRIG